MAAQRFKPRPLRLAENPKHEIRNPKQNPNTKY